MALCLLKHVTQVAGVPRSDPGASAIRSLLAAADSNDKRMAQEDLSVVEGEVEVGAEQEAKEERSIRRQLKEIKNSLVRSWHSTLAVRRILCSVQQSFVSFPGSVVHGF